uniref:Extracellular solute-binding protein n=1 Tax=Candidatus Kentrum eta TaxID=2126337 RepID=A0A450V246_9GAMM|nr:MAG: extracellular solute-binding protein [Candidatus Kentron sp. H]VFJ92192.1 MAG: extracellular solute-binding protein [Candidatus Kentron sp. H]VFJ98863.1 MAG: extracellular solute-binding protein [Candidatus Kentron sp. H]
MATISHFFATIPISPKIYYTVESICIPTNNEDRGKEKMQNSAFGKLKKHRLFVGNSRLIRLPRGALGALAGALVAVLWTGAAQAAREKTRALVKQVRFFSNDPTTLEQALARGEVIAATVWNESIVRLKEQGLPIAFMDPKEGRMTWVCGISIVEGTRHTDKVYDIIDALLAKESRVWEIEHFGYGAATRKAFEAVDEARLREPGLSRDPEAFLATGVFQRPIENEKGLQEMFDEVKAGF